MAIFTAIRRASSRVRNVVDDVPIADIHGAVQITETIMSIITVAIITGPSILVDGAIGLRQRNHSHPDKPT